MFLNKEHDDITSKQRNIDTSNVGWGYGTGKALLPAGREEKLRIGSHVFRRPSSTSAAQLTDARV
jgi:hypothetical protein